MRRIVCSFRFAWQGIVYCVKSQPNMRLHVLAAVFASFFGWFLDFSRAEKLILLLTITMVLLAEMINTAVETVIDMISPGFHPLAKVAKDVAAGAVLITAVTAVLVGWFLFVPKVLLLIHQIGK